MNDKLKNNWTRLIFMRPSNDKGFALPIAMGVGLFLLLISSLLIFRSQGDRVVASTQKAANQGLNAAETAVSRYQDLINNNRQVANRNLSEWVSVNTNLCQGSNTTIINMSSSEWQDVDSSDSTKGQYKLIGYTFNPDKKVSAEDLGTSTLKVQGRVNQIGSGNAAQTDILTSTSQIEIEVPILQGDLNSVNVPGLWLTVGGAGNNTIDADVLLNDCSAFTIDSSGTLVPKTSEIKVTSNRTVLPTNMQFPNLPAKPTFTATQTLGDITGSLTLPRLTDVPNASGFYEYSVNSINLATNSSLTVTPGRKVRLYLNGGINNRGNSDIIHTCGSVAGCKPTDFQIYGYGDSTNKICTQGNNVIEAFIFAPQYTVGVAGSGGGQGGIKGSIWAKQWANGGGGGNPCGSSTQNTVLVQKATWGDIGLTPRDLPPKLGNISQWKRQEVE